MGAGIVSGGDTLSWSEPRSRDAVAAEAALWMVRTADDRDGGRGDEGFRRWLAEHPQHRTAFADASAMWRDIGVATARTRPAEVMPNRPWFRSPSGLGWVAALAACLLLFVAIRSWPASAPVYATTVGEQRSIRLSDTTKVVLNTDTRIEIDYDAARRRVVLDRGEALFEVAHNPARPFYVDTGTGYVRAVGTTFIVRRNDRGVEVTLLDGKVLVGENIAASRPPVALRAGDRLRFGDGTGPVVDRPVIDDVTAWRRGELVFDGTPLPSAIAEMNRYSNRPIVLRGAGVAGARLSGTFETGESEAFARTLAAIYGLKATKTADGYRLDAPADGRSR